MRVPQSLDEIRRMRPEDQMKAGEMLGRLLVLNPQELAKITQIRPEELQSLISSPASTAPEAPGATGVAQEYPVPSRTTEAPRGTKGVLSDLAEEPKGLTIKDTKTGTSRLAKPGDPLGPTEVLMHGNQILQAGLRAQASLRRPQGQSGRVY